MKNLEAETARLIEAVQGTTGATSSALLVIQEKDRQFADLLKVTLGLADFLPAVHQKIQAYSEHNAHLVAKLAEARDTLHAICACATVSTDEDHLAALDDLAMKLAIWLDPLQKNGKTLAEETQSALTAFLPAAYTALDAARSQAVINSETRVPLALAIAANPSLADTLPTKGGT